MGNQECNQNVKKVLRKHYVQIMTELQEVLKVDDIQTIAEIELKYSDNRGNKFEIS